MDYYNNINKSSRWVELSDPKNLIIRVIPPAEIMPEIILDSEIENLTLSKWNFPGQEGQKTKVFIFADECEVELFINGETFGRKKVGIDSNYRAEFDVIYQPGLIEAISYHKHLEFGHAILT